MQHQEVKKHYKSGQLRCHYLLVENGDRHGEYREYHENGKLSWHAFSHTGWHYGEVKMFNSDGILRNHYLIDGKGNELAVVIYYDESTTHSEGQLIEIAKEHNLPLLSEIPKAEAERTLWNLKHPDCPCLSNESE